jgi:glycosyltransferase involved in cell wall biosynthesis
VTHNARRRYLVVLPTRNEESLLQNTLDCLVRQTIRPTHTVIVNDGSTDRTAEIADANAKIHPWITVVHRPDRGERKVGGGVVDAFYAGYESVDPTAFDYVCKLDADLTFSERYFEGIIARLEENPKLAAASGKVWNPTLGEGRLFEERIIDEQVSGAAKFYRREAFEDIGGFVREVMWDGIDFHRARMCGWQTRSFRDDDLRLFHHRLMGSSHKSIFHGRRRWGRGQWFMGTHPLYILASAVFRMRERPFVLGGGMILAGYVQAALQGAPRYDDRPFRRSLHEWQLKRLGLGLLARRPKEPPK